MEPIKSASFPKLKQHLRITVSDRLEAVRLPEGVRIHSLKKHEDDRGYFMEVIRASQLVGMDFDFRQASLSETRAGVVKAFHFHLKQSDLFCPVVGRFELVLLDGREGSPTHGNGYSIFTDEKRPFLLRIPPGVAHGYRVLGDSPAIMLYIMNREYDPEDERRLDWNDPSIGFPW